MVSDQSQRAGYCAFAYVYAGQHNASSANTRMGAKDNASCVNGSEFAGRLRPNQRARGEIIRFGEEPYAVG